MSGLTIAGIPSMICNVSLVGLIFPAPIAELAEVVDREDFISQQAVNHSAELERQGVPDTFLDIYSCLWYIHAGSDDMYHITDSFTFPESYRRGVHRL